MKNRMALIDRSNIVRFIEVERLEAGAVFGHEGLNFYPQQKRSHNTHTKTDCLIAFISSLAYNKIMTNIEKRQENERIMFLSQIPVFSRLTKATLGKIANALKIKTVNRDGILFKEGD